GRSAHASDCRPARVPDLLHRPRRRRPASRLGRRRRGPRSGRGPCGGRNGSWRSSCVLAPTRQFAQDGAMTDTSSERIAKRLARAGIASRRGAEAMILEGRVEVNGVRIDSPALNVGPGHRIMVDGRALPEAEAARLWRYHKPAGLVTTARDEKGRT